MTTPTESAGEMPEVPAEPIVAPSDDSIPGLRGLARTSWRRIAPIVRRPETLTWVGVVTAVAGLALIVYGWGQVAGLTHVGLQIPYVISGGFLGLSLVVIGVQGVSLAAKRAASAARTNQWNDLSAAIARLRDELDGQR